MSGEKNGNNWNGYTGFEGGENRVSVISTGDTADVEDVDMNSCITIIRKDPSSTDQPMLLEGVKNSLIFSTKLQYFYVRNHSLGREHYTRTSNDQVLLLYNCIATSKLSIHIVYSLQYCLIEGIACNDRHLVFLGVRANKSKPFTVQCYIYNMEKSCILRIQPHKVSIFL